MSSGRIYLLRIDKTSVPSKSNYLCNIRYLFKGNCFGNFCFEHKDIAKKELSDCFYLCKRNFTTFFAIRAPFGCINEVRKILFTSLIMKQK